MSGREIKITLPLYVYLPRKRREDKIFRLNLNVYRNAHYQVLHQAKKEFFSALLPQIEGIKKKGSVSPPPYKLLYVLFVPSTRRVDITNVCSILDKFACDVLVQAGVLRDDDAHTIAAVEYRFGGVDRGSPRCELIIKTVPG